eukprot:CAMPEP_0172489648 /NCGR_PEP_ID=MMETSP1066-20121228/19804_1 /TAXON_ID=671091 /ORGANISM="Coscinodiscus wailesii, Strain CCMP2513" /LENGTH=131 /DNA_ID=CAMNT_0013257673 /DNA_START=35 /DNA_END=427 /DNA_ORIENTATION=+
MTFSCVSVYVFSTLASLGTKNPPYFAGTKVGMSLASNAYDLIDTLASDIDNTIIIVATIVAYIDIIVVIIIIVVAVNVVATIIINFDPNCSLTNTRTNNIITIAVIAAYIDTVATDINNTIIIIAAVVAYI